jgi:hypothetical protein
MNFKILLKHPITPTLSHPSQPEIKQLGSNSITFDFIRYVTIPSLCQVIGDLDWVSRRILQSLRTLSASTQLGHNGFFSSHYAFIIPTIQRYRICDKSNVDKRSTMP